jgi:ribosomal-protein-alanine acetyltransferase
MRPDDIPPALEIAASLPEAPHWEQNTYINALDPAAAPERIALVTEPREGGVDGFLVTVLIPPQAEVETIAVARDAQRQGIATRLLRELLLMLQKRQITEVMLEVRESNRPARAFYASAGFSENGRRTGYYREPKEDAILLTRAVMGAPDRRMAPEDE